jgi:diadenosine tetraphosphatase ApaH/serine/threonine PP2A family protein phosphatase
MRYAIISDIHSNLAAFQAVLLDVDARGGADHLWCLGDIVGYGPDPNECINLLRQYDHTCIAGNHDWGALGRVDLSYFNDDAAAACRWTGRVLGTDETDYLGSLSLTRYEGDFTLAHGSPRDPIWEYLMAPYEADVSFHLFRTRYCLVGHTHVPLIFESPGDCCESVLHRLSPDAPLELGQNRLIVNPGSVGQPRDADPQASYALFDTESRSIHHCRVPYDIAATQQRMDEQGLPPRLAARLGYGW